MPAAGPSPRHVRNDVALVHDYLLVLRGAERTFAAMMELWPEAPIHTLLYDEQGTWGRFAEREVIPSPALQRLRLTQSGFRRMLPVLPLAAQRLRVQDAGLVISSSSAFAHGVRPAPGAHHVCYCHSPFRYAYHERRRALQEVPGPARPALGAVLAGVRAWDRRAAVRVDTYVANSEITRERIAVFYGRDDVELVHPPVEVERFSAAPAAPGEHLLIVCELVAHKRVDVALEAARRAGRRVKVVGTGPEQAALEARYGGHTAEFLGRVGDDALIDLYRHALAFVMPNVEEFGIAAVEAQAAGRPVLGIDRGGARETVLPGETGILVPDGDPDAMTAALREVDWEAFDSARCRANAQRFRTEAFWAGLLDAVLRASGG